MAMEGMDKITARIRADAQAESDQLAAEAEAKVRVLRMQAEQEAKQIYDRLAAEGDAEAEKQYSLQVAAADTQARKATLALKQEMLTEVFRAAVKALRAMDGKDYIAFLARLAVRASETGTEAVILNAADRDAYGAKIVAEANRISGKKLVLSEETRPLSGGLVLSQGRIEVNCSLDTLAEQQRSTLSAEAAKRLFG